MIQTLESSIVELFSSAGAVLYLAYLALVKSSLPVSSVIVLTNSIWQISSSFLMVLAILPQLQEHHRYLKDYREFMDIKAGEKIAIVGHNGAGKSTLIKLMIRLYLPCEGRITMDHIEASQYNLLSYPERFATVFQDFQIYATELSGNIWMKHMNHTDENRHP